MLGMYVDSRAVKEVLFMEYVAFILLRKSLVDAKKTLAGFKEKVEPEMEAFFERVISENEKSDKNIASAMRHARKITMSGGKRARAAFMYYGYLAAGGEDKKEMLKVSISIELIHAFLLMHDDIIDCDELRHGVRTMHAQYADVARRNFKGKDAEHFGNSIAIIMGDILSALGNQVLFESKFDPKVVVSALRKMQGIIACTAIGEAQDVYIENRGDADEAEILRMYENKTAKYTIEGPLHLGAILAGADDGFIQSLSRYAIPAGMAFQIQDDILGVFEKSKKIGKPVGSDVRQGKRTILVSRAFANADSKQKKVLERCLGNDRLTDSDLDEFKKVIIETGALEYARGLAEKMIIESKREIAKVPMRKEAKEFLVGIADYMLNREF